MKTGLKHPGRFITATLLIILFAVVQTNAQAFMKPEISGYYEFMPATNLAEPDAGTFWEDLEVQTSRIGFEASNPFVFSRGKTIFNPQLSFEYLKVNYDNWDAVEGDGDPNITDLYSGNLTMMLMHMINPGWSMMAIVSPGVASDFEGAVTFDDFNFQAGLIFMRNFNRFTQLGFGAVYSTSFGHAIPLPALSFNWNNGSNMRFNVILPVRIQFTYGLNRNADLGILMRVSGNDYRGASKIYEVNDPRLNVSDWMVGPTFDYRLSGALAVSLHAGYTFVREFEFSNGEDEIASYDLEGGPFLRVGLSLTGK